MAGRKLNELPDDDHPRIEFVRRLRALWEEAGSPTFKSLAQRLGYRQPQLSELFNAKICPSAEMLSDVVQGLNGNDQEWAQRLADLVASEAALQAAAFKAENDPSVELARLRQEIATLRELARDPDSGLARAEAAMTAAEARIRQAEELEQGVRELIRRLEENSRVAHESVPAAQSQAIRTLALAEQEASQFRLDARADRERIISEARAHAAGINELAISTADRIVDRAREESSQLQAQTGATIDRLLAEADVLREDAEQQSRYAEAERLQAERRAMKATSNMVARAKLEIERTVREAQRRLEASGSVSAAADLDKLLLDFNIGGSHEPGTALHGRHRRPPVEENNLATALMAKQPG